MVVPDNYAITIIIGGTDVTSDVPYNSCSMDLHQRQVSTFRCQINNPTTPPVKDDRVKIYSTTQGLIFSGYVTRLRQKKRDNGVETIYEVECADEFIRLQNSVIDFCESTNSSEQDVLTDLLGCTFPDLSSDFDFTSGVNSVLDNLDFTANNLSLADALEDFSDSVGGRNYGLSNSASAGGSLTVSYDESSTNQPPGFNYAISTDTDVELAQLDLDGTLNGGTVTGFSSGINTGIGNPDTATQVTIDDVNIAVDPIQYVQSYTLSQVIDIYEITFDNYIDASSIPGNFFIGIRLYDANNEQIVSGAAIISGGGSLAGATWQGFNATDNTNFSFPYAVKRVSIYLSIQADVTDLDWRLDNIVFDVDGNTRLDWGQDLQTDFDLDIDLSDEFGSDFELDIGDYDDFNSVTVTGGYEAVNIDWIYGDVVNDENRVNLETAIDDIEVFKNTGTDGSPTWTALTTGVFGADEFVSDGGTADVLHDTQNQWLFFDNPYPAFEDNAVRVTGSIRKPVRVRVNNYSDDDVIAATTYHNENISSEQQAVNVGTELLDQQQTVKSLTFKTYNPGLLPGQELNVTDSNVGINETLKVRAVRVNWIGSSGHAEFDIECGNKQEDSADVIMARNSKKANEVDVPPGTTVKSVQFLTDDNDEFLTDDNDERLYVVTG